MAYTTDPILSEMEDADLAQLISDAQVEQKTREIESAASATLARVQAYIAERPQLVGLGIVANADMQDGAWVRIAFPIATEPDPNRKALMLGSVQMIIENYGGQQIDGPAERETGV